MRRSVSGVDVVPCQLTLKANTLELKINRVWRTNHYRYWNGCACICVCVVSVN